MSNQVRNQQSTDLGYTWRSDPAFRNRLKLKANKAHIDFENNTLSIQENLLNVPLNNIETNEHYANVKTIAVEVIPPHCEMIIRVRLSVRHRTNSTVILEPNLSNDVKNLVGSKVVVNVQNGKALYRILNPTRLNKSIKVNKSQNVDKELGIKINEILNANQRKQLTELLTSNRKVFAKNITEFGKTKYHYHRIDTGDAPPVQSMPYSQTPQMSEEKEKHIDITLKNYIIEESNSPSSPIVLVHKKKSNMDAKQEFRFAVDYLDASDYAIGYVLEQLNPNTKLEHVVAYGGRSLNKNEQKRHINEKEGLALKEGIKHFNPYLATQKFTVYTDNITLRWIETIKNIQGRLGRWALELQGYDFEIMHRPGKKNNADALSRREYEQQGPTFYPYTEAEETVASLIDNNYEIITFDYEGDEEQQLNILAITDNTH
ncbi:unnamed protein product [Mytilus coruscus]|uniref:Reverse transcriptase RNase H-like domain-containing protein n=1 Tax=Mytilus coruscus TaxID=42192 RepID=A0A6J8APW3_MYTCO|nr:unnamed protein product [Mytilus coruscus]